MFLCWLHKASVSCFLAAGKCCSSCEANWSTCPIPAHVCRIAPTSRRLRPGSPPNVPTLGRYRPVPVRPASILRLCAGLVPKRTLTKAHCSTCQADFGCDTVVLFALRFFDSPSNLWRTTLPTYPEKSKPVFGPGAPPERHQVPNASATVCGSTHVFMRILGCTMQHMYGNCTRLAPRSLNNWPTWPKKCLR